MLALLSLLIVSCTKQQDFITINSGKQPIKVNIELARTEAEIEKGLMFRTRLPEENGMLFIFPDADVRYFWMKNTLVPLDMIFIAADGTIVSIQKNVQPCRTDSCQIYPSIYPAKYVLEVNGNFTEKNDIKIGEVLDLKKFT